MTWLAALGIRPLASRHIGRSPFVFADGVVEIGGRKTAVRFMFDPKKNNAYPDWGWRGMDANGDGRIDGRANSDEFTYANDETVP